MSHPNSPSPSRDTPSPRQLSVEAQGLLDIGQACTFCNNIDYLPYVCDHCELTFCTDHRSTLAHRCVKAPNVDSHLPSKAPPPAPDSKALKITIDGDRGRRLGDSDKALKKADLDRQRAEAQKRSDEANARRLQALEKKKEQDEKRKEGNGAALERLKALLGTKTTTTSKPNSTIVKKPVSKPVITKPAVNRASPSSTSTPTSNGTTRAWALFAGTGNTTRSSSSGNASASKLSVAALSQLRKSAKPLDPNRPQNAAINGEPTNRRYVVLVAYSKVVGKVNDGLHDTSADSKTVTVYMAKDILVGKLADKAVEILRIPRTKEVEEENDGKTNKVIKKVAFFFEGEMLKYGEKLDKAVGGKVKDGDRLVVKYV